MEKRSEQSLVWWLDAHQADIDRGLTAVVGLVLECLEQPRIAGVCDISHARNFAIFAWIQSFYILNGGVVAFTYIIYDGILALRGGALFDVAVGPIDFFAIMPVVLLAGHPVYLFTSGDHVQEALSQARCNICSAKLRILSTGLKEYLSAGIVLR